MTSPLAILRWGLLMGAALVMRVAGLGLAPLWFDEATRLTYARDHLGRCLTFDGVFSEPLFFLLLAGWQQLGSGETWLRLHAALAGVLTVGAAAWLGNVLGGRRAAWGGALFAAVSPPLVYYSRDANMYGLALLWSILILAAGISFVQGGRPEISLACYGLAAWALLHTQLTSPPFLGLFGVLVCAGLASSRQWRRMALWLWVNAVVLLLSTPLALGMLRFHGHIEGMAFWAPPPSPERLLWALHNLAVAYAPAAWPAWTAGLLLLGLAAWAAICAKSYRRGVVLLLLCAAGLAGVFYGLSQVGTRSYFVARYFIQAGAIVWVLAGVGWALLPKRALRAATAALLAVALVPSLTAVYTLELSPRWNEHPGVFLRPDARAAAQALEAACPRCASVFHLSPHMQMLSRWYAPHRKHVMASTGAAEPSGPGRTESLIWEDPVPLEELRKQTRPYALALPLHLPHFYNRAESLALYAQGGAALRLDRCFGAPYAPSRVLCLDPAVPGGYPCETVLLPGLPKAGFINELPPPIRAAWHADGGKGAVIAFENQTGSNAALFWQATEAPAAALAFDMSRIDPWESAWQLGPFRVRNALRPAWRATLLETPEDPGLETSLDLPPGRWRIWVEHVAQGTRFPAPAATVTLTTAGGRELPREALAANSLGGWQWSSFGPVEPTAPGPLRLTISARCPAGLVEAHAAIAQVAATDADSAAKPARGPQALAIPKDGRAAVSFSTDPAPRYVLLWTAEHYAVVGPPRGDER